MKRRGTLVAAVALALCVAACTSGSDSDPAQGPTTQPSVTAEPTDSPEPDGQAGSGPLDVADAIGIRNVAEVILTIDGNEPELRAAVGVASIHGDTVLVERSSIVLPGEGTEPHVAFELHDSTGAVSTLADYHPGETQTAGVAHTEDVVVWMETTSFGLHEQPWRLRALHRRSGEMGILAESPLVGDNPPPPPPGWTGPLVSADRVYWAQVGGDPEAVTVGIYSCRWVDCRPELLVAGAAYPSVDEDAIYFIGSDLYAGERSGRDFHLGRVVLASGEVTRLREFGDDLVTGMAAAGGRVVVTFGSRVEIHDMSDVSNGSPVVIGGRGSFVYPDATPAFAVWADGNTGRGRNVGGYLYHYESGGLYALGNARGLYAITAGDDLVHWQEENDHGGVINVVARIP